MEPVTMTGTMERVLFAVAFDAANNEEHECYFTRDEVALFVAMTYQIPAVETLAAIDRAIEECGLKTWGEFKAMLRDSQKKPKS